MDTQGIWPFAQLIVTLAMPVVLGVVGYVVKELKSVGNENERLRDDLHNFRVEVARDYVSHDRLEKEISKILTAILRLEEKLDRRV